MHYQLIPYAYLLFASAGVSLCITLFSLPRRQVPGAVPFIVLMITSTVWSIANAFEMMGTDLTSKLFWANAQYVCYVFIGMGWLFMALQYAGLGRWLNPRRISLLLLIPAITVILVWTDGLHGLMRKNVHLNTSGPFPVIGKTYGPWFWVYSAYMYPVILVACFIYIRAMFRMWRLYRWPTLVLLVGMILPYATNFAFITHSLPFGFDVSPLAFSVCGVLYTWGLFRFELFDRLPAAQSLALSCMGEGLLVTDRRGHAIEMNSVALEILRACASLGKTPEELFGPEFGSNLRKSPEEGACKVEIEKSGTTRCLDVRWWTVRDKWKKTNGQVFLIRDETEIKAAQDELISQKQLSATLEERDRLARELHDSLGQIMGYLGLRVQTVRSRLRDGDQREIDEHLVQIYQVIEESNQEIREFIYDIKTSHLFKKGFFGTLSEYLDKTALDSGLHIDMSNPDGLSDDEFPPSTQAQLFRVIQEAVVNIRKHSGANHATLRFAREGNRAVVSIRDEGSGFEGVASEKDSHFGLGVMRERCALMGGELRIESRLGEGTKIVIAIPIEPCQGPGEGDSANETEASVSLGGSWTVLLADDHALFVDGLKGLLAQRGFQVVSTARNGWEALEKARVHRPDLVLMDIEMPECDGLMAARLVISELPKTKVVILTMSDREKDRREAMRSGASGYLVKGMNAAALIARLLDIARSDFELPGSTALSLGPRSTNNADETESSVLTPRQAEIIGLAAQSWTYKEIGAKLFVSERTVKFHMNRILKTLKLKNKAELVAWARNRGME